MRRGSSVLFSVYSNMQLSATVSEQYPLVYEQAADLPACIVRGRLSCAWLFSMSQECWQGSRTRVLVSATPYDLIAEHLFMLLFPPQDGGQPTKRHFLLKY